MSGAKRYSRYAHLFRRALARLPSRGAYINALMHMYGHFKDAIDAAERQTFLELLEAFGKGQRSFHDVAGVIAGWCERFGYGYLADQSLLAPYPLSLVAANKRLRVQPSERSAVW